MIAGMNPFGIVGSRVWQGASSLWKSPSVRRTAIGAAAGGLYGGMSDDTSVLGGAVMGGVLGRYGGAGLSRAIRPHVGAGLGFNGHMRAAASMFAQGLRVQGSRDMNSIKRLGGAMGKPVGGALGRAAMATNNGYNKIRGMFR